VDTIPGQPVEGSAAAHPGPSPSAAAEGIGVLARESPLSARESPEGASKGADQSADAEEPEAFVSATPLPGTGVRSRDSELPILVVDDDPEDRLLVRTILQKHGYQVKEARDGGQALQRIGAGDAHAMVILDLEMPTMGGREVLAVLRSSAATMAVPVIVLTGSPDPEEECRVMEEGADDYLRKPLDAPRFVARVKAALRRAGMA
jgi:CheY-like chemotaxis protein